MHDTFFWSQVNGLFKALYLIINQGTPRLSEESEKRASQEFLSFLASCLEIDVEKRPTAEELLKVIEFLFWDEVAFHVFLLHKMGFDR